jgi:very-short-patch-repair endonuclease
VVSSFSSHDVDPERLTKAGARLLAEYLEYADAGGTRLAASGAEAADPFEVSVSSRLAEFGIIVVPQYGVGGYRVDFAAAHPDDPSRMILAVEADGASYRDSGSVRDRDRLRKEHLERLGWRFHRLWSTNWFQDPDTEVAKLREAYEKAVASSPYIPPVPPVDDVTAAEPDPASAEPAVPSASDPTAAEPDPDPAAERLEAPAGGAAAPSVPPEPEITPASPGAVAVRASATPSTRLPAFPAHGRRHDGPLSRL